MGLDSQLVHDGTHDVVLDQGQIVGCGGWSRREAMYGGDRSPGRHSPLLDADAARVPAMDTVPAHARRGIGRSILGLCEAAARVEGFRRAELVSTLSGAPLCRACGYEPIEEFVEARGGAGVPVLRMRKALCAISR